MIPAQDFSHISGNISAIRERIALACKRVGRQAGEVALVAVTKNVPIEAVRTAAHAGIADFGENRLQEAEPKIASAAGLKARWHFLGRIQSNKLGKILESFQVIQSFADPDALESAEAKLAASGLTKEALLQINISGESSKGGFTYGEAGAFFGGREDESFRALKITGLMGIGPLTGDREAVRASFREFKAFFDKVKKGRPAMRTLSMGMSGDFEIAVEEGSTMLRIGTAIFGERR